MDGSGFTDIYMYATIPGETYGRAAEVNFPAFNIDITDSTNSEWNEYSEPGRADPKFMYASYSRTIGINFTVASFQRNQHQDTIRRLNSIARMLKPVYRTGLGFNGVFCSISIGRFIREDGILTSFNATPDSESSWSNGFPMIINCDIELRVIERTRPDFEESNAGHFLGNVKGSVRQYYMVNKSKV